MDHLYQLEDECRCWFWCITFLWVNGCQFGEANFWAFLGIFNISYYVIHRPTKMLYTKIHIYHSFPVDTGGQWCQNFSKNMFYLSLKIFHRFPLVSSVLKFQMQSGAPKPRSISFFWPFSINTWSFAPENACGAKHFTLGVILGRPR